MDIARLYAQAGSTGNNGSLKYTDRLPFIPITDYPFPDSYYLGYIKYWFNWQKTTQATHNVDTNEVIFTDITDYSEYPSLGYYLNGGLGMEIPSNYFYDESQTTPHYVNSILSDSYSNYLVNNFHPQAVSMRSLFLRFAFLGYSTNGNGIPQNELSLNISQFLSFLNGNLSLTITNTWTGTQYTLSRNDFTTDCYYEIDSTHRIILCDGYFSSTGYYDDNTILYNQLLKIFAESNYKILDASLKCISSGEFIAPSNSSGICTLRYNGSAYVYYNRYAKNIANNNTTGGVITSPIIGHVAGRIKLSDLSYDGAFVLCDEDITSQTYAAVYYSAGEYLIKVFWNYTFAEIYKSASVYRWTTADVYGYSDEVAYYPTFNPDDMNEFTLELQTGTQTELQPLLPIWYRLDNIQASDYTDADKPAPTPEDEVTTEKHNGENSLPALAGIRTVSGDAFSTFYHLSMYHVAELGQLISQMPQSFWEALGTATDYKQANILDYLVSLKWYPLNVVDSTDTVTSDVQFGFNGIAKITFTAAGTSYKIGNINRIYDMGSITIPYRAAEQSFLDLEPYTSVSAYLPYIGTVSLQANDVVGYTITCTYIVDLTTGMCTGILDNGTDTVYIGTGKIGVDISVSGNDILTQAEKMSSSYIGAASSAISNTLSLGASVADANVAGAASAMISAVTDLATSAIGIANSKRGIPETVGSASGFGGAYTHQAPYIRVQRPAVSIPGKYGHDVGYVCNRSYTIGTLSGYTVCSNPDLSGIPATSAEIDMIRTLLISGFYA